MLRAETELRVRIKVGGDGLTINDLVRGLFDQRDVMCGDVVARFLWEVQEEALGRVLSGADEIVCTRCGVVHSGPGSVLRRGRRRRRVRSSLGRIEFGLRQVTCSDCHRTWCPFTERLGLRPRQRVLEELLRRLVDWVTELSYEKTTRMGGEWLGATVSPRTLHAEVQRRGAMLEFTEAEPLGTVVADGTKVPAGARLRGEELSVAFQLQGRRAENGRPVVDKRVIGIGVGVGHWQETLATDGEPDLLVTDGETGLRELVGWYFERTRHQLCEWHVAYSMAHMLGLDGMAVAERKKLSGKLNGIMSRGGAWARHQYRRIVESLDAYPRAQGLLERAEPFVLYSPPSAERTTSVMEREMREVNRRTDVGARWSVSGITNLTKLRLAKRHNPDDYERSWNPLHNPAHIAVSTC